MNRLRITILVLGAVVLVFLVGLWLRAHRSFPVALIRVLDPSGKPVAGAVIKPDGLKPKKTGGHYLWVEDRYPVKPSEVATGKDGYARVAYPFYVSERLETGEISFSVNHPDFVPDQPIRRVSATPTSSTPLHQRVLFWAMALWRHKPFTVDPVVLQPGAIVKVAGYKGAGLVVLTGIFAEVSGMWATDTNAWRQMPDGSLLTRRVPPGPRMLRLVWVSEEGVAHFSDLVQFQANVGQTNEFRLELKPGLRLNGKLDIKVPRPVSGGRVIAEVWPENGKPGPDSLRWHTWSEVASNGDFVLGPLPTGQLEIVGICDGYISENGPPKPNYAGVRVPQLLESVSEGRSITLKMEPAAALKTIVLDDKGQPLKGATVSFWPNVVWGGYGTRVFGSDLWTTLDGFAGRKPWLTRGFSSPFEATSDAQGVAVVCNLPADASEFAVSHPDFDMPPVKTPWGDTQRVARVVLTPGQTNEMTIRLQRRGTAVIRN
ncbi:MAG TPA: hypothetical protein VJA21_24475 [Verrucomicrobiae bacterium]